MHPACTAALHHPQPALPRSALTYQDELDCIAVAAERLHAEGSAQHDIYAEGHVTGSYAEQLHMTQQQSQLADMHKVCISSIAALARHEP